MFEKAISICVINWVVHTKNLNIQVVHIKFFSFPTMLEFPFASVIFLSFFLIMYLTDCENIDYLFVCRNKVRARVFCEGPTPWFLNLGAKPTVDHASETFKGIHQFCEHYKMVENLLKPSKLRFSTFLKKYAAVSSKTSSRSFFCHYAVLRIGKEGLDCRLLRNWFLAKQTSSFVYAILNTK